jgi:hypothetical protein
MAENGCERVTTGAGIDPGLTLDDPDLTRLIAVWPMLPEAVRVMIRAAVDSLGIEGKLSGQR